MLKHIVMWKLKDQAEGADKAANALKMKAMLDKLPATIKAIKYFEVGISCDGSAGISDIVLVSAFDNAAGLADYVKHPDHEAVVGFIKAVVAERRCVDYTV